MRNLTPGRSGAVRPLWAEADSLRERVAEADALFAFFSFDSALSQRASHGHLRTNPACRAEASDAHGRTVQWGMAAGGAAFRLGGPAVYRCLDPPGPS